ncbi:MAG: hypothetical protein HDT47_07955 [Ruminococcaceae bacterium]|nr:hypothetical protein [Oscillospiraceae bacterium]
MKIGGSINAQNTIFANKSNLLDEAKHKNPFNSKTYDLKKYDTFTMVGTDGADKVNVKNMSMSERFKTNNAELIRELDGLSKEEKAEVAVVSYLEMQKHIIHTKNGHENAIDHFNQLRDAKAYYSDLLNGDGKITEEYKKYGELGLGLLDGSVGDIADKDELRNAVNDIQGRIDSLIGRYSGESSNGDWFNDAGAKIYTGFGVMFSTVTGIYDDSLTADGSTDLLDTIEGINEENFIEKQNEVINKLDQRSEKLKDVMNDYMKYNDVAKELMKDPGKLFEKNHNKLLEQQREAQRQLKELEQLKEFTYAHKHKEDEEEMKKTAGKPF